VKAPRKSNELMDGAVMNGRYAWSMGARAHVWVLVALGVMGCARPDTVVHVSAANDTRWEVRDDEGAFVCSLPCSVELDEEEAFSVVRADGKSRFDLRQQQLGEGSFSATVRVRRKNTNGTLAARVFAAALTGAGSVLAESDNRGQAAAGAVLSGMGAAVLIASNDARSSREELWVERTATSESAR
jgi:hypothetical protein